MKPLIACAILAAVLTLTFTLDAGAGIGKIGPVDYSKKKAPNAKKEFYRYLLYQDYSPHLNDKPVKAGNMSRKKILWALLPDPVPAPAKATAETPKAAEDAKEEKPAQPGVPGLTGVPGLGR